MPCSFQGLLKHDPVTDLTRQSGRYPGPLDEINMWETRLSKLQSINEQLDSPVAQDILRNLQDAQSTYSQSFQNVRRDVNKVKYSCIMWICLFMSIKLTPLYGMLSQQIGGNEGGNNV